MAVPLSWAPVTSGVRLLRRADQQKGAEHKGAARALAATSERAAAQRAIISPHLERNPRE